MYFLLSAFSEANHHVGYVHKEKIKGDNCQTSKVAVFFAYKLCKADNRKAGAVTYF